MAECASYHLSSYGGLRIERMRTVCWGPFFDGRRGLEFRQLCLHNYRTKNAVPASLLP